MSTYLVAFVVGELEATEPVMVGPTPIRVWCVPGKKHLARFALDVGAYSLDFFERYYGLPYPGDKVDLLAIPDFAAGAMENLGAITFRENALLVNEVRPPMPSWSASPTWSPTSSPTCGSAIS
jgi:puromycin-sensitive aminopeptidase